MRYRSRMSKSVMKKKAPANKKTGGKKGGKKKAGAITSGGALKTGGKPADDASLTNTAPETFSGTGCVGCPESFTTAIPASMQPDIATGGTKTTYSPDQGGMMTDDSGCQQGGALSSGGAVTTGGSLKTGGKLRVGGKIGVDKTLQYITNDMTYPEAVHALGSMDPESYYILQGVAGGFLKDVDHPLREPYIKHFGGGFEHPSNISKVATRDILKAETPCKLAGMLHSEWRDHNRGLKVGGGLLDSLKNVFKKGVSGLKTGSKAAYEAGKKLHSALERGISIAEQLAGPLAPLKEYIPENVGEKVKSAIDKAEAASKTLGTALKVAEEVGKVVSKG